VFLQQRARIVQFAADHRIPAVYGFREFVDVGGLFSYAASLAGMLRRVPYFVDKIIKGAKPGDLPWSRLGRSSS
jgi:putative ABC transport system substrate-binding protein